MADRTSADSAQQRDAADEGDADLALDPTGELWGFFVDALRAAGRPVVVGKMAATVATLSVQSVSWRQVDVARLLHGQHPGLRASAVPGRRSPVGTARRLGVPTDRHHLAEAPRRGARNVVSRTRPGRRPSAALGHPSTTPPARPHGCHHSPRATAGGPRPRSGPQDRTGSIEGHRGASTSHHRGAVGPPLGRAGLRRTYVRMPARRSGSTLGGPDQGSPQCR